MFRRLAIYVSVAILVHPYLGHQSSAEFLLESIDNDFPSEIEMAKDGGKNLLIMFSQEGCPFCEKMRQRVIPNQKVDQFFSKHFVMIVSNIKGNLEVVTPAGQSMNEANMARKYRIRATPVYLFFDTAGEEALRLTGYLEPNIFLKAGEFVVDKAYKKNLSFYQYLSAGKN